MWSTGDICTACREYVGVSTYEVWSNGRSKRSVECFTLSVAMLRTLRQTSYPQIALMLHKRSHSACMNAYGRWMAREPEERFRILMDISERMLENAQARADRWLHLADVARAGQ